MGPDWQFNRHNVLLPLQGEDKYRGLRSIGRSQTSLAVTRQVLKMLREVVAASCLLILLRMPDPRSVLEEGARG